MISESVNIGTGEIVLREWSEYYKIAKRSSDKYLKEYNILNICNIVKNYSVLKMYLYIRDKAEYSTNRVDISTDMKKDMSDTLKITYSNISNYLKNLYDLNILIRLPSGSKRTLVHPYYSWVGKESVRLEVLEFLSQKGICSEFTELLDKIYVREKEIMLVQKCIKMR